MDTIDTLWLRTFNKMKKMPAADCNVSWRYFYKATFETEILPAMAPYTRRKRACTNIGSFKHGLRIFEALNMV